MTKQSSGSVSGLLGLAFAVISFGHLAAQETQPASLTAAQSSAAAAQSAVAAEASQSATEHGQDDQAVDGKKVVPRPAATSPAAKGKKGKEPYTGPMTVVELPPTPMLDEEKNQRLDPDGKPMFNPPVTQLRDKKGHPVFDADGKPVFATATNLGYDEKGKKIAVKKVKVAKMEPVSISAGTLTVDGWTGKARLNYDIADLKYLYVFAPGIGTSIVSRNPFPGAKEQPGAFNGKSLKITVDGHPIELASDKLLLGKKPESAWVVVDRDFLLPAKFPVFGFGTTTKAPYVWPGSKEGGLEKGAAQAPPLPADVRPALLLTPCPAGMMRPAGPPVLPGQKAQVQPCVPISTPSASTATPAQAIPAPASTK